MGSEFGRIALVLIATLAPRQMPGLALGKSSPKKSKAPTSPMHRSLRCYDRMAVMAAAYPRRHAQSLLNKPKGIMLVSLDAIDKGDKVLYSDLGFRVEKAGKVGVMVVTVGKSTRF